jgi:hypothetical protein
MEVVDTNQTTFLLMMYILDNVLLMQETIDWARQSNQPLVFIKLDFVKAYDKVSWGFLFMALEKMGMVVEFINMVKVLFQDMKAIVCINGGITSSFKVERRVRQGCSLAPYLFILVGEVLNFMMKEATSRGIIKGISLMGVQINK